MKNNEEFYRKNINLLPVYTEFTIGKEVIVDEPRGKLEKVVVVDNDELKIVKFNNSENDDQDLIEYLLYIFLSKLEIPSMVVELGYKKDKEKSKDCCIVTDVVKKRYGNSAIVLEDAFYNKEERLSYTMTMEQSITIMFEIIKELGIINEEYNIILNNYINMLLCDFLFDNPDRHLENYFLIYNSINNGYSFAPLIDNGNCFESYKDNFYRYHIGFCQYKREEYINFLIERYYYQLKPLINKINESFSLEYINSILELPHFAKMDVKRKKYIINLLMNNISLMNELVSLKINDKKVK